MSRYLSAMLQRVSPSALANRGHDHHGFGGGDSHNHEGSENEALLHSMPQKKTLTRRQINKCLLDMDDTHPLKHMVGVKHITSLLGYLPFFKKQNVDFRHSVRVSLCAELGVKIPESELQLRD